MPLSGTRYSPTTPNAQRPTLNAQCLNGSGAIEVLSVGRWALGVEREPRRFLTPQHQFIDRPDRSPSFSGV
jgi:hypothetical protein